MRRSPPRAGSKSRPSNGGCRRRSSIAWRDWTIRQGMMTVDDDLDIRRREAAAWFARLSQRRVSTDDVKAFSAWRRDPDNARAYERGESVWASSREPAG